MLRRGLIALAATLFVGAPALSPAFAQGLALPTVSADWTTAPLAIEQLDSDERAQFAALPAGSDDARRFLFTRGYLRYCKLVVSGTLPPLQLPNLPAEENWDRKFFTPEESKNILDVALGMKMIAMIGPPRPAPPPINPALAEANGLPGVDAEGTSLPLAVDKLSKEERAVFAGLDPDSADARRYLYVRGFLRYSRLVVEGKISPPQLPGLPARENWDRRWLSDEEAHNVLDVALAANLTAKLTPPPRQ